MIQEQLIIAHLKPYLPKVKQWINDLLQAHAASAKPLSTLHFARISKYYSQSTIDNTKVVLVDNLPKIPLTAMGLTNFMNFEAIETAAATYVDTIFIEQKFQDAEALFFHELVHILQWQIFGYDNFLLAYGLGLFQHPESYSKSFFETMAYENQAIFQDSNIPFKVEKKLIPAIEEYKLSLGVINGRYHHRS